MAKDRFEVTFTGKTMGEVFQKVLAFVGAFKGFDLVKPEEKEDEKTDDSARRRGLAAMQH